MASPFKDTICEQCGRPDFTSDNDILLCDGCNRGCHMACAGLASIPEGHWFCAACTVLGPGRPRAARGNKAVKPKLEPGAALATKRKRGRGSGGGAGGGRKPGGREGDDDDDHSGDGWQERAPPGGNLMPALAGLQAGLLQPPPAQPQMWLPSLAPGPQPALMPMAGPDAASGLLGLPMTLPAHGWQQAALPNPNNFQPQPMMPLPALIAQQQEQMALTQHAQQQEQMAMAKEAQRLNKLMLEAMAQNRQQTAEMIRLYKENQARLIGPLGQQPGLQGSSGSGVGGGNGGAPGTAAVGSLLQRLQCLDQLVSRGVLSSQQAESIKVAVLAAEHDPTRRLVEAADLRDRQLLSAAEFDSLRASLLSQIT